jgi:HK97 family phage prohead protease
MRLVVVHDKSKWVPAVKSAPVTTTPPRELWKRFDASLSIEPADAKSFIPVKTGDTVTDYMDVRIKGYLSTFADANETDRQGEYVIPGAFADTIAKFMTNPVMLKDHVNMVAYLVGNFTKMTEDVRGLYVEGLLSNSPDCRDTRFKVAEGMLKTMSIGGLWYYKEDGRGIFKVDLFEGSLTPVPANPKAIISTRSLSDADYKHLKRLGRDEIITRLNLKELPDQKMAA